MDDTLAQVQARVAERFPADLERIRAHLRMPSVSAAGEGIGAVAEATGAWIEGDRRLLAELAAGYVGPGGKTIVPSRAVARVDIRLVGGDPEVGAAAFLLAHAGLDGAER